MSEKARKKKTQQLQPQHRPVPSSTKSILWDVVYWIFVLIVSILFISDFAGNDHYTNSFIKINNQHVLVWQYVINLSLIAIAGYFGYILIFSKKIENKLRLGLKLIAWLGLFGLSVLSFKDLISQAGDNAEYIVGAKSLVEKGAFYKLYSLDERVSDRLPPVISLMLAPVYKLFGTDITKMKWVILSCYILSIPLFYLIAKHFLNEHWAVILSIVVFANPLLLHMSSMIMTELPYIFWSLLCIYMVVLFSKEKAFTKKFLVLGILSGFLSVWVFLTRSVGVGMLPAFVFYMFLLVDFKRLLKKDYSVFKTFEFKRLLSVIAIVLFFGIVYLLYEKLFVGVSKAVMASEKISLSGNVYRNLKYTWEVWAQMIFPKNVAGWSIDPSKFTLQPMNTLWGIVTLGSASSLIFAVYKKIYPVIASVFCYGIILVASNSPASMVMSRYLLIFVPVAVFALIYSIYYLLHNFKRTKKFSIPIALGCSALILLSSFKGNGVLVQKENSPKNIGFVNYMEMGEWCKENLSGDVYIASRKPRLFYLFSDRKGFFVTNYRDISKYVTNGKVDFPAYQAYKFQEWKEKEVDYIVLDGFNGSTAQNIYPIVNSNPDKFQLVHKIGEQAPSYLVKVNL